MNDEVSVAELLVREGWGDRSGTGQSRWRVLAVMLAVVIGCGAAAVLVGLSGKGTENASPVDQIQVIPFPQRTTGLGGAGQATDSPPEGGTGGGDVVPGAGVPRETVTEVPGRTTTTESSTESATPTTTPTSGAPGSSVTPTSTPPGGHHPTTTPAPPPPSCLLIICW
ncbi:hypothetical protein Amsp01_069920 [Amycolatopsis sp. NBRC 101858]|uniref:hypothetical protein n=1 Tax=Amycolatopsis sp. NBRC 101858 TaxID=3032200 RepID=UPI0024A1ED06|nr:hypothetical protein [Amycolatopsis sp. NBRC 101858]GLY40969.1 hypothetical protein Amsp01_069920 [Amycolatopsis sp. NBRC 101858]